MVAILEAFLAALESKPFHEVAVEDVCETANVSKMTFFRYFNSKEEVLDYFALRWCCQRTVEIHAGAYRGEAGIRHVFQSASEIPNAIRILTAMLQYYSKLKEPPAKRDLSAYERYLLAGENPGGFDMEILSLRGILVHYVDELELPDARKAHFVDHLSTLFYGVPFQVYTGMIGGASLSDAYRSHLDFMFA